MEYNHMNVFWGFLKYKRVTGNTPDLRRHLQACTLDSSYVFIRNEVPPHKKSQVRQTQRLMICDGQFRGPSPLEILY